jgi:uncharacterized C2H2 Zn-finger protein
MTQYNCKRCGKIFDRKYNYERHINDTKKKCIEFLSLEQNREQSSISRIPSNVELSNIEPNEEDDNKKNNSCPHCEKSYSAKFNLNKHLKKCVLASKSSQIIEEKEKLYKEHIDHLEQQILELTKKIGNTYSYNINQHLDQSVHQQNIQINSYGNENLNYITARQVEKLISHPSTCLPQFIKMVHYHEQHPENHNVIMENIIKTLKEKNNWDTSRFEEFVEKFAIEKYDQLYDLYNSNEVDVDEVIRDKFEKWADQFDYVESQTRKKAEEDAKLAIILGSKWLRTKKITKRGLKRILDGEMLLNEDDMKQIEKIKKNVGWNSYIKIKES